MTGLYLSRYGESQHHFNRHDKRLYCIDNEWYFLVRRGYDQGPYESEGEARGALIDFVQKQLNFEKKPSITGR